MSRRTAAWTARFGPGRDRHAHHGGAEALYGRGPAGGSPTRRGVGRRRRLGTVAVWTLVALCVAGNVAGLRLVVLTGAALMDDLPFVVASLGIVAVGALLVHRRPDNVVGWLLAVAGGFGGFINWIDRYVPHAHAGLADPSTGAVWATWVGTWSWVLVIIPLFALLPLIFPDGRLPSRRWRPLLWLMVGTVSVQVLTQALRPGPLRWGPDRLANNPLGIDALGTYADAIITGSEFASVPLLFAAYAAPVVRWRRSRGIERQQLKWFVAAVALLALFVPPAFADLLPPDPIGTILFSLVILAVPIAVGIAVLRYRLYEIDRLVSRTVSYALLTTVLVGVYTLGVVGLGALVRALTGVESSDLVVAASTLAVAALFGPLRRRIQAAVDRRFRRERYNAARTIEVFGQRLRDEVDLDLIGRELVDVAGEALQPSMIGLWLRSEVH